MEPKMPSYEQFKTINKQGKAFGDTVAKITGTNNLSDIYNATCTM